MKFISTNIEWQKIGQTPKVWGTYNRLCDKADGLPIGDFFDVCCRLLHAPPRRSVGQNQVLARRLHAARTPALRHANYRGESPLKIAHGSVSAVARTSAAVWVLALAGCGLFGPDPNGPGSFQAVSQAIKSAEESLTKAGAKLEQKQYPPGTGWAVDLTGTEVTDKTFETLRKLGYIAELNLNGTKVTDAHMKHLSGEGVGSVLVNLNLVNTEITDEGLKQVKDSLYLMSLNLSGSKVSSAGVDQWLKDRAADSRIQPNFKKTKVFR